jgi:hypothetical protein
MYLDKTFFVGFSSFINFPELVTEPLAPSHFKDPNKIEQRVCDSNARRLPLLPFCPCVGGIRHVTAHNWAGKCVFLSREDYDPPAVQFWRWVEEYAYGGRLPAWTCASASAITLENIEVAFFGLKIKSFFQVAALEAIAYNKDSSESLPAYLPVPVPVQLWRDHIGVFDVYESLLTPEQRKLVSFKSLVEFLLHESINEESVFEHPRRQAMLAWQLAKFGQLLGSYPERDIGFSREFVSRVSKDSEARSAPAG